MRVVERREGPLPMAQYKLQAGMPLSYRVAIAVCLRKHSLSACIHSICKRMEIFTGGGIQKENKRRK